MTNLITQSQAIKKEADLVLNKLDLLPILKKYGQTEIVGSYKYDLMLNRDLDIHLFNPKFDRTLALSIFQDLIKIKGLKKYMFDDWYHWLNSRWPKGYYLGLKYIHRGNEWKIDIWCLDNQNTNEKKWSNLIKKNLNDRNREIILTLKDYRNKKLPQIPSVDIYQAVLVHNIGNIDQFKTYLKNRK